MELLLFSLEIELGPLVFVRGDLNPLLGTENDFLLPSPHGELRLDVKPQRLGVSDSFLESLSSVPPARDNCEFADTDGELGFCPYWPPLMV